LAAFISNSPWRKTIQLFKVKNGRSIIHKYDTEKEIKSLKPFSQLLKFNQCRLTNAERQAGACHKVLGTSVTLIP